MTTQISPTVFFDLLTIVSIIKRLVLIVFVDLEGLSTMDRTLYWMPGTCALAVHVALEQIGAPYKSAAVGRDEIKSPSYLALNPSGVVPTLVENGEPLVEAGAILLHLTDLHSGSGLGPAVGEPERMEFYRWIAFLTGTMHPHFWPFFFPERYAAPPEMHAEVLLAAQKRIAADWVMIEAHLEGRDWLVGDAPTVADGMLLPIARWSMRLDSPPTNQPQLAAYLTRLEAWPPAVRALAAQDLQPLFGSTP